MVLNVLSVSLSMSIVILVLILMRKHINKKYSARVMCMIWLFVALRLLIPVEIDLPVSKVNLELNMDQIITEVDLPAIETPEFNNTIQLDQTIKVEETEMPAANFLISWQDVVTCVWFAGAVYMLVKQVLAYCSISKWLKRNSVYEKTIDGFKVYLSSVLPEPLSFGTFKSSIYLTEQFRTDNWVLNHELMHCKHYDGLMMWIAAFVKSIHWFNPLVYWMDKQWEADRELYCDEAVLKDKTKSERIEYMVTLYDAAEAMNEQKLKFASGLLDGEHQMVERFKMIQTNKVKRTSVVLASVLCILILIASSLVGCTSTDSKLVNTMIELIQSENVQSREISMSKVMDEDGLGYSNGTIYFDEVNLKYQKLSEELDSLREQAEKLNEELKTNNSKDEYAKITSVIFQVNDEILTRELAIESLTQEIDDRKEEYIKTVVGILEKMKLKKKDKLDVVNEDTIPLNVTVKMENGDILKMQFYESEQLVVSIMNGFVKSDVEVYDYEKETLDLFHALMQYDRKWGFLETSGGLSVVE